MRIQPNDVVNAVLLCHFCGLIAAPIVDNQILDLINAGKLAWQSMQRDRQSLGFVITRYLDDQLHAGLSQRGLRIIGKYNTGGVRFQAPVPTQFPAQSNTTA